MQYAYNKVILKETPIKHKTRLNFLEVRAGFNVVCAYLWACRTRLRKTVQPRSVISKGLFWPK